MSESRTTAPSVRPATEVPAEDAAQSKKIDLSVTQIVGGALAAMTAAALGSRLGVAGTVIGAAMASVVAAVGSSLYTASIRASRERVRTVLVRTPSTPSAEADADPNQVTAPVPSGKRSRGDVLRPTRRTLRAAALATLAAFAVAAVAVTGFELATGQTLSGDNGTTVGQVSRDVGDASTPTPPRDDRSAEPSAEPSSQPSVSATGDPSPSPSTEPSDSAGPSTDPSATESSSADPSARPSSGTTSPPEPSAGAQSEEAGSAETDAG